MEFGIIGLNYKETPIELRERVHFYEKDIIEVLSNFMESSIEEALILSTCNRSEIYFIANDIENTIKNIEDYIDSYFSVNLSDSQIVKKTGGEALRHLFYTAIGLESLVVGEDQILGQITDAQILAIEVGAAKKYLNKIFREAITFAKITKTQSSISAIPTSISYMGVRKIEEENDIKGKKALVIGVGEMGKLSAKYLLERGAVVRVANRTYENSVKVAKELGGIEICNYKDLDQEILNSAIVVTATASPHLVIKERNILPRKSDLFIMDLGLPRDVEEKVGKINGVKLYDIDSLKEISDENMQKKKDILKNFLPNIEEKIDEIELWWTQSEVDPIMQSASERCAEIAEMTLNYINRKTSLNPMEKRKIEKIVKAGIRRAMREPLVALKNLEDSEEKNIAIKVMKEVFKSWDTIH